MMRMYRIFLVCFMACAARAQSGYAGAQACGKCHSDVASKQSKTAMANTWQDTSSAAVRSATGAERKDNFSVQRLAKGLQILINMPSGTKITLPVDAMVGGGRHGISLLGRVTQVDGIAIERPALIEGRYALSPHGGLVLSSGFSPETPATYEDAVGRVLSPTFEKRCLTCHGQPHSLGAGDQGGVRCESCHGPSASHATALTKQSPIRGAAGMDVCAQCHTGLNTTSHSDLIPEDLLVSSQVPALRNSECFIQSGENVSCTNCHNPHNDSARVAEATVKTCIGCHSVGTQGHAAICPVNQTRECIGCHMPSLDRADFHLVDHWIRVHPEQGIRATKNDAGWRTQVTPKREYLRIAVVEDSAKATELDRRLAKGDSFRSVAHDLSVDDTAPGGGFIGDMRLADMDPLLASAAGELPYGGTSKVIDQGARKIVLHRLERDFKYDANRLYEEASALKTRADLKGAIAKNQQALEVYPYFLRALIFMGTSIGEAGDAGRAAEVLGFAAQTYPKDAAAQFDLALTLGKQPAEQIKALQRTIELDPDMVAAYQSLGVALYTSGQAQSAIEVFHQGLQVDPLSAILYYDLGLALKEQGDTAGAAKAAKLAGALDPTIATRRTN